MNRGKGYRLSTMLMLVPCDVVLSYNPISRHGPLRLLQMASGPNRLGGAGRSGSSFKSAFQPSIVFRRLDTPGGAGWTERPNRLRDQME